MKKTNVPFHEALLQRVTLTGDVTPGNWNFAADIVRICANYMEGWTRRFDDASRIPDILYEAAEYLNHEALPEDKDNVKKEEPENKCINCETIKPVIKIAQEDLLYIRKKLAEKGIECTPQQVGNQLLEARPDLKIVDMPGYMTLSKRLLPPNIKKELIDDLREILDDLVLGIETLISLKGQE